MGKVETFLGKDLEDRIHFTLVTLSKERARIGGTTPPWLESAIYQLELTLADLEGSRIAAGGLRATVEEILEIVKKETRIVTAVMRIENRFETLLRRSDEGQG